MAEKRLTVKLDETTDKDIIDFLDDKPQSYFVKLALRRFMNDSRALLSDVPDHEEKIEKPAPKSDAGSVLGNW